MVHCAPLSTGLRCPAEWAASRQSPVVRCVARRPIGRLPVLNGFGNHVKASSGREVRFNRNGPFLSGVEDKWIDRTVCEAAKAEVAVKEDDGGIGRVLFLGVLFAGWYGANVFFNIYNKQVLKVFPFPITCTLLQFFVGSVLAGLSWLTGLLKPPKIDKKMLLLILPLACVHTLGNLFTNVSLGRVAVSFTHTIKALEPFFSVVLSSIFLGERASFLVLLTLFPIVGGVAAASMSEVTFNWPGFLSAMGSNLSFQSRNVLSKKTMGDAKMPIDNFNLFSIITVMSFFILLPFSLLAEGFALTPGAMRGLGILNPMDIITRALYAAVLFHTYQQVSYMILERVSPVTHSIGNCLKRVIVIVTSVIVFGNFMSNQSKIGTAVALVGVFLYSQAKRISKPKSSGPGVKVSVDVKVD